MNWQFLYNLFKRSEYNPISIEKITGEDKTICVAMLKRDILTAEKHHKLFVLFSKSYYDALVELSDKEIERAYRTYLDYLLKLNELKKIANKPYKEYYKIVMGKEYVEE